LALTVPALRAFTVPSIVTTLSTRRIEEAAPAVAVGDDLGDAVMVAQVHEQHAAMVALAMDPARGGHPDPQLEVEGAAGVRTIGMHRNSFHSSGHEGTGRI
jgi:hypothetical protein